MIYYEVSLLSAPNRRINLFPTKLYDVKTDILNLFLVIVVSFFITTNTNNTFSFFVKFPLQCNTL